MKTVTFKTINEQKMAINLITNTNYYNTFYINEIVNKFQIH